MTGLGSAAHDARLDFPKIRRCNLCTHVQPKFPAVIHLCSEHLLVALLVYRKDFCLIRDENVGADDKGKAQRLQLADQAWPGLFRQGLQCDHTPKQIVNAHIAFGHSLYPGVHQLLAGGNIAH